MSSVHDTITEALRAHRPSAKWCEHGGLLCSCGHHSCGRQTDHSATAVLAALESGGFVVRKQVEPAPEPYAPISRELLEEARNDPANHALRKWFNDTLKASFEPPLEQP